MKQSSVGRLPCWLSHSWEKWSAAEAWRTYSILFRQHSTCMAQERKCAKCGKIQIRDIEE